MKRSFIHEILEHTSGDVISFAGGLPDEALFPTAALQEAAAIALKESTAFQYGRSTGYAPLREQIAKHYCDIGFATTAENILITTGSQQALDIICRYHASKRILTERPSYLGAMNLFALNRVQTVPIALGSEGIDIEAFEAALPHAALVYLIPDFQNPTGTTYSLKWRERIAALCRQYNTLLIEDAPYSELYFDEPLPSISSMLPRQSFHLGSFSKVLSPALRIGWIRAESRLLSPLIAYKEAMDLHTSLITQRIVSVYLYEPHRFAQHKATLRAHYYEKMQHFADVLERHLPAFAFTRPKGGMFIYGKLKGIDTAKLVQTCLENGVVFVPGSEFGGAYDEIRFNFTHSAFEEMEEGVRRIKKSLG